jgi:phospholipase/carboxylesterase
MFNLKVLQQGQPLNKAKKALILLHGRGGTAEDIITLADEFCDEDFYIVAPEGSHNVWYPHPFMSEDSLNEPQLTASVNRIEALIDDISQHIPPDQIYLMGFSQGACMSLEISTRHAQKYGGVIAFTGGLIGKKINEKKYHGNFEGTNVFIGTSQNDPFIALSRIQESKVVMEKMGAQVTLKVYPGSSHTISPEEIQWVKNEYF